MGVQFYYPIKILDFAFDFFLSLLDISMMDEDVDPFILFQEELEEDDIEIIVAAIQRLETIALALGPERTREELLPFLANFDENNDEARTHIAEQLGSFVEVVGGVEYAGILLPVLGGFAAAEETVLREAAIAALLKVLEKMRDEDIVNQFIPLLRKLCTGEWFTNRVSAAALLPPCYSRSPQNLQEELRKCYNALLVDDTPMVRMVVFRYLPTYIPCLNKEQVLVDIFPALKSLLEDGSDSMRVLGVPSLACLANFFEENEYQEHLFPFVEAVSEDASWRVRHALAKELASIAKAAGIEFASSTLFPIFCSLLTDTEAEVRTVALQNLEKVAGFVNQEMIVKLLPQTIEALSADQIQSVRVAFSEIIIKLSTFLGPEASTSIVVPAVVMLLYDEDYEVRLNIIDTLHILVDVLGVGILSAEILPAVFSMVADIKWRVRLSVIGKASMLTENTSVEAFDTSPIKRLLIEALSDSVFAVRNCACNQICEIVRKRGVEWGNQYIIPEVFAIYDNSGNYLHRMVPLNFIVMVSEFVSKAELASLALPVVLKACCDPVSNVRFAAAKTIISIVSCLDHNIIKSDVIPILQQMANDDDVDVIYFATEALSQAQEVQLPVTGDS